MDEEEDERRSSLGVQEDEQENGRGTSPGVIADKQGTSLAVVEDEPKSVGGSQSNNMIHDPVSLARGKSLNRYNQTPASHVQNSFCK